jgi:hypothetical protein
MTPGKENEMKMQTGIRNITVSIFSILILLCAVSTGWATIYYVDYQNGSDLNIGTSIDTPLKHAPGDSRATDNAKIILSPGDIVVFKGGITYSFNSSNSDYLAANSSGTPENYIIYRSGHIHSPQWGTTRAIIDGTYSDFSGDISGVLSLRTYNYLKVQGLEIKHYNNTTGYLGCISAGISTSGHIVIDNCILHECDHGVYLMGKWNNDGNPPYDFVITNNELYDNCEHGLLVRGYISNITISNNIIHDNGNTALNRSCVGDGIFSSTAISTTARPQKLTISNNSIYDHPTKGWMIFQGAEHVVVEKNYLWEKNTSVAFGISINCGNDFTIRNNLMVDTKKATKFEGMIRVWTDNAIPEIWRDNVNGLYIYNNTMIGNSCGHILYFHWANGYTISNVEINNNIFDPKITVPNPVCGEADYIHFHDGAISGLTSNNNIFYNGDSAPFSWNNTTHSFSQWQSRAGQDSNSIMGDPLLDAYYIPLSNSPVIDKGMDLSSKVFSNDKDGRIRPFNNKWDIGAYEFTTIPPRSPYLY